MPEAFLRDRRKDVEHAAVRVLASARTLEEAAPRVLAGMCEALGWEIGQLWEADHGSRHLRCVASWSRDPGRTAPFERESRGRPLAYGEGLPGRVWALGQPAWIPDAVRDPNFPRGTVAAECGLHGGFAFPVFTRDDFFGAIEFFTSEIHEPDDDLLLLVERLGATVGHLVERERLERRLAFQNAVLESQSEASPDGIIVVDADERILYANRRFTELWQLPQELIDRGDHREVLRYKLTKLADPESIVDIVGVGPAQDTPLHQEVALRDGRTLDRWTMPLRGAGGHPLGWALFYRDVTEQKALEQQLRNNEEWLSFLAEATTVMSSSLDRTKELEDLARLVVPPLADWCLVHLVEADGRIVPAAAWHEDPERREDLRTAHLETDVDPGSRSPIVRAVRSGRPVFVNDARSAVVVPFTCRGRVLGALTLVASRTYSPETVRLLEDLAARVAFPLDNARLYEERAQIAKTLQESLLPPDLPQIPGVELAAHYYPATDGVDVGGDFYDVFPTSGRHWAIALGDVSGKGVGAAAVTALVRHTLRAAAMTTARSSAILRILNTALYEQTPEDRFCTTVYARVEPRFGRVKVTIACGGHPPPYVVRSDGTVVRVGPTGIALGIVPYPRIEDTTIELGFGDKLVLYTDGLLDIETEHGSFGPDELERLLPGCARRGTAAAARLIADTVLGMQGGAPADDIALVVLGVRASIFRIGRRPGERAHLPSEGGDVHHPDTTSPAG